MRPAFTDSRISIKFPGKAVPGADDRHKELIGFDQKRVLGDEPAR